MPIRLPSHRNRCGILYFRIAIPADLRVHFGQAEVYRSLNTAKVIEAALSAQTLALSFKSLFRQLREESMCATKKKSSNAGTKVGMIMELSLDEFRRPKGKITTEPGDTPAMVQSAIHAMAAMLNTPAKHPIEVTPALAVGPASKFLSGTSSNRTWRTSRRPTSRLKRHSTLTAPRSFYSSTSSATSCSAP
jgi:hypothetical protein